MCFLCVCGVFDFGCEVVEIILIVSTCFLALLTAFGEVRCVHA